MAYSVFLKIPKIKTPKLHYFQLSLLWTPLFFKSYKFLCFYYYVVLFTELELLSILYVPKLEDCSDQSPEDFDLDPNTHSHVIALLTEEDEKELGHSDSSNIQVCESYRSICAKENREGVRN